MGEEEAHQPHDKLFKVGLGDPVNAAAFLRAQFEADLAGQIDWTQLQSEQAGFVDPEFRGSESDLLFSAPIDGSSCLIYVLLEHQRQFDPWIALRLLRYMVRIWERFHRENPRVESLPGILPVVVAQNAVRWELEPRFAALVNVLEGTEAHVPDFAFRLIQLAEMEYAEVPGTPAGILVLRTLKAEQVAELLGDAVWDEALMVQALSVFEFVLRYILTRGDVDIEAFETRLKRVREPEIAEKAMTLAEQLILRGRDEGREEGREEESRLSILMVLESRFGPVPLEVRERIERVGDSDRLRTWLLRAVGCVDLDEFRTFL